MKRVSHYQALPGDLHTPHVVTIGNFDGVHLGHRALLKAAKNAADNADIPLAVITFDPHPAQVMGKNTHALRLLTSNDKARRLADCGVDVALFQQFDDAFANLTTKAFVKEVLHDAFYASKVFVGDNFRFGKDRGGGIRTLSKLGTPYGIEVIGHPLLTVDDQVVSSSRIRELLSQGSVKEAAALLGWEYEINGKVLPDRQMGRQMGYPTINLQETEVMIPRSGIYASRCQVDNHWHPAAAYVGERPTLGTGFSIEAHLLDYNGELYDQFVTLRFIEWIRADRKFENTDLLIKQITTDINNIKRVLNNPS